MILGDLNQARPNANGENTPLQARRPIQGYQFIQTAFDGGKGDYRALQVKVERRYSDGLYLLNSFTWSRARDNASGHLETANGDNSRVNYAEPRRRVRHLRLQPAAQQHHDGDLGTAVRPRPPVGRRHRRRGQRAARRLAGHGDQHHDERRAGEPELLAGRELQRQRRADLSSERDRRHLRRRNRTDHATGSTRRTWSSRPTRRSRSATRRETPRAARRSTCSIWACTRASHLVAQQPPGVPSRSVQRVQPDELRGAERQPLVDGLRHDHVPGDSAASDSAWREGRFLIVLR